MDSFSGANLLKRLKVKYFWVYITEKCNLDCKYCFYKSKNRRINIDFRNIKLLLEYILNAACSPEFVISGGEPLLEWDLSVKIIDYIKSKYNKFILLQTNGILLDRDKIKFIKDKNIGLELGLDGGMSTSAKYRSGISEYFNKIIDNISIARANKIKIFATMTVHPKEAGRIFENYKYLIDLGIQKVEITPAAFEKWDKRSVVDFKKGYREVVRYAIACKHLGSISIEYDKPLRQPVIDLVILPGNNVVTNWALLSLPRDLGKKYSFLNIDSKKVSFNHMSNVLFLKYLDLFRNKNVTYRDFSNLNAKLVYNELFKRNESFFDNYRDIGDFLKNINQKVLLINEKDSAFRK